MSVQTFISSKKRIKELKKKFYSKLENKLSHIKLPIQGDSLFGPSPPNILVGSYGYPKVRWGPLISMDPETEDMISDYSKLYGKSYEDIIQNFSFTIKGERISNIFSRERILRNAQDIVLSHKPIDIEMKVKNRPYFNPEFDPYVTPHGYKTNIKSIILADNPKIPKPVYRIINDDVKAIDSVIELYNSGMDVYYTTRLLTSGLLGQAKEKKLVPTRWSITAVDDMITQYNLNKIRTYLELDRYFVYENEFLFNRFYILLLPGNWEYEQFEAWPKQSPWGTSWGFNEEYEPFTGRKKYAETQAGGYYAARIAVTEHLIRIRKQARVVVFREIDEEYCIPIGVWQVRENVRKAFHNKPFVTDNLRDALNHIRPKLKNDLSEYLKKSIVLTQTRLIFSPNVK
ncbi:hypothetical protein J7J26_03555 [Candidatus Micrarchaeota archaeon]|nr:hypothetical protein [Candidatus Micrarchaeota archaeon]